MTLQLTMDLEINETPQDVVDELSLELSMTYNVQNFTGVVVFIGQYEDAPEDDELIYSHFIKPGENYPITPNGTKIWVWTASERQVGRIIVTRSS